MLLSVNVTDIVIGHCNTNDSKFEVAYWIEWPKLHSAIGLKVQFFSETRILQNQISQNLKNNDIFSFWNFMK